jgi:hypothetical protein
MKSILRSNLVKLGGAPDAKFAIFYHSGDLYFCTTHEHVPVDEGYWAERGYTCKEVIDEAIAT